MPDSQFALRSTTDRRTTERRNLEMYGVADMDAIARDVTLRLSKDETCMALTVVALISAAQEIMVYDLPTAQQILNRVKFLLYRCCPMPNPD